jgi:16S rRNA (guanine527-N7)-methyltransferase
VEIIAKYFPDLSPLQKERFGRLFDLYADWNGKINVISRKDIEHLYLHHVLHSLAILKYMELPDGVNVLDVGTGGGFPGIPLAIMFPKVNFTLVDSIGKKIKVVNEVAKELGLTNVIGKHNRAEELGQKFEFVVSRAVTKLPVIFSWIKKSIRNGKTNGLTHGVLYLKGGDIEAELRELNWPVTTHPISKYFSESFFEEKYVVHIKMP